jgi:hypothetical protein
MGTQCSLSSVCLLRAALHVIALVVQNREFALEISENILSFVDIEFFNTAASLEFENEVFCLS